jgi:hypothetical protein
VSTSLSKTAQATKKQICLRFSKKRETKKHHKHFAQRWTRFGTAFAIPRLVPVMS